MVFDASFVQKLGSLARLELDEEAASRLAGDLSRILAAAERLPESLEEEDAGAVGRRADVPQHSGPEALLAESAGRKGSWVTVPSVKEGA